MPNSNSNIQPDFQNNNNNANFNLVNKVIGILGILFVLAFAAVAALFGADIKTTLLQTNDDFIKDNVGVIFPKYDPIVEDPLFGDSENLEVLTDQKVTSLQPLFSEGEIMNNYTFTLAKKELTPEFSAILYSGFYKKENSLVISSELIGLPYLNNSQFNYEGWLKDGDKEAISTGFFVISADNLMFNDFTYVDNNYSADKKYKYFVTMEPADKNPNPTGVMVVEGEF